MRTPIISLLGILAVAACSSGTRTIIVREPAPAPAPVPQSVDPLEVTVGRPVGGRLLVQTNRAAYVAIFEIVPDRGVRLVYPTAPRQRRYMMSGMNWVPVWWSTQRASYYRGGYGDESQPDRFVYAIASDEPLRIPDAAFEEGYLQQLLGLRAYRASYPYATMRAIAREFVPAVIDEEWAEDAYALAPAYASEPGRVVRVYCGGRVYEVSVEMADRVWCPGNSRPEDAPMVRRPPMRPDSVVGETGRRLPTPPRRRGALSRVTEAMAGSNGNGNGNGRGPGDDRDRAGNQGNGRGQGRPEDVGPRGRGPENPRRDSVVQHNDTQRPDDVRPRDDVRTHPVPLPGNGGRVIPGNGNSANGNSGNGNSATGRDTTQRGTQGRGIIGRTLGRTGNGGNPSAGNPGRGNDNGRGNAGTDPRGEPRTDPQPQSDPRGAKPDDKPQQPADVKPQSDDKGQKPEDRGRQPEDRGQKPDDAGRAPKQDPTPEHAADGPKQQERSDKAEAKSDDKAQPKAEPRAEPKSDDDKSDKGNDKGAEHGKSHGKPASSDEQKGEKKGKP